MFNLYNKTKWYDWEEIVVNYYLDKWYDIISQNYTIKWWEVDIIVESAREVVFVEVKVVDGLDDISGIVNPKKIFFLEKTIEDYVYKQNIDKDIRLDVVFVKDKSIFQVYENVTNS